jgi:L-lactate dehydrogenase
MKLGIVGAGNVGWAICTGGSDPRRSARDIVLVNRTSKTAEAVATDVRDGTTLCPKAGIRCGNFVVDPGFFTRLVYEGL